MAEHVRRTDPRYDRRLEVEIAAGKQRLAAVSKNISLGGIYAETSEIVPLHTSLEVRFRVPTQPEPIEVGGEVRWVERGSNGKPSVMGIRFQGLRARDVWALNRFFQTSKDQ